ncbi:MAG: ABC transporter permease [Spirochaetales bacterium]|nr:ABC transporter permease [Spirochaetales bacterium]
MKAVKHIIKKEFRQLPRNRMLLPLIFISPILQLLILGYAANLDVRDIPLAVYDMDRSAASRELVSGFLNSGYFTLAGYAESSGEADAAIDDGFASLSLIIPHGYSRSINSGKTADIQIFVDGSESNSAIIGMNYASMIISGLNSKIMMQRLNNLPEKYRSFLRPFRIITETRVWYNPELKSRNFMVPGVLAMILMIITVLLTSLSIVREKELGTLEQLNVTPIKPYELIIGKLLPFSLISFVQIALTLFACYLLFGLAVKGSLVLLFTLSGVFMLTTLGLGLLISTFARNQQQAMLITIFFIMVPMIILSGFVFPIKNMPEIIQAVTYFLPLRYFFVIIRGIFLKGVGINELWLETLALLVIGIITITVSIFRFRKRVG